MKYVLIMLTWFGTVPEMEQEVEYFRTEQLCEEFKARIEKAWAGSPREFVGVMLCETYKDGQKE